MLTSGAAFILYIYGTLKNVKNTHIQMYMHAQSSCRSGAFMLYIYRLRLYLFLFFHSTPFRQLYSLQLSAAGSFSLATFHADDLVFCGSCRHTWPSSFLAGLILCPPVQAAVPFTGSWLRDRILCMRWGRIGETCQRHPNGTPVAPQWHPQWHPNGTREIPIHSPPRLDKGYGNILHYSYI